MALCEASLKHYVFMYTVICNLSLNRVQDDPYNYYRHIVLSYKNIYSMPFRKSTSKIYNMKIFGGNNVKAIPSWSSVLTLKFLRILNIYIHYKYF